MSRPKPGAYYICTCRIVTASAIGLLAACISLVGAVTSLGGRLSPGLPTPRAARPRQSQTGEWAPAPDTGPHVQGVNHFGEITVAQPKIWQYERVNSLLDGLLRDVQGVSLADLTSLDPNAPNGTAVQFVQSILSIGAQYDQGASTLNSLALQNYQQNQAVANAQTQANQAYLQQLYQERTQTNTQLLSAMQLNSSLMAQLATAPAGTDTSTLQTQQTAANGEVTTLQQELTAINTQITAASTATAPTLPSLASTAPPTAPTPSGFLSSLPSGLQQQLVNQLQTPTLPATKRLDNFMTLLYERLAREISALQDDLLRDPQNLAFLVQFDVSLYPSKHAENRVGVVDFGLECQECTVYSIYPGQSSYNFTDYSAKSKYVGILGVFQSLIGLGVTAAYSRQQDTLRQDLVQSVYISGFQEGAKSYDRALDDNHNPEKVQQRFGWYYGAAPFEKSITQGQRSTFAIITVPRHAVLQCQREGMKQNQCTVPGLTWDKTAGEHGEVELKIQVHAGWVPHDDPLAHQSRYLPSPNGLGAMAKPMEIVLPGVEGATLPAVVLAERDRLHLLGIEYNPVYSSAPSTNPNTPPAAAPGTAQAAATGNGAGSATVTVSGAGTASATSTGSSNSTASATATNPTPSTSSTPTNGFTGCPQTNPCAGVLLKLAEPIDPDMVVTVRGQPLLRVRDWRGRATSILPAAQSASDRPAASSTASTTAAATPPQGSENTASASLLEADQLGPNTWMEVDSHRLLLNISQSLAGDEEFPAIQIVAPAKRALFIPVDLDTNFTEVVTNGFHLIGRDESQLIDYACDHLTAAGCKEKPPAANVHPTGPYPSQTFLPLFLPEPDDQPIEAEMGETGLQLLIGFAGDSGSTASATPPKAHIWLASRTQVILEDSQLDLAWSLACHPQGEQLACDFPRVEMDEAYNIMNRVCNKAEYSGSCPSIPKLNYPSIASLQVWVEQTDPGDSTANAFRSSTPARLDRLPLEPDVGTGPDSNFSPWHFESTTPEILTLAGCRYSDDGFLPGEDVDLLGQHIPSGSKTVKLVDAEAGCLSFDVPTIALTHPELVIRYHGPAYDQDPPDYLSTPQFRPFFGHPIVSVQKMPAPDGTFPVGGWTVDMLAGNVDCSDSLDVADAFTVPASAPKWEIAGQPRPLLSPSAAPPPTGCQLPNWQQLSKDGQLHLVLTITKENLPAYLERQSIHLTRGQAHFEIATLPDLRSLLLPTQLTVAPISETQFALQGINAEAIDKVSLQGPGAPPQLLSASISDGIAIFTLPASAKGSPTGQASQPATAGGQPKITKLSSSSADAGGTLTITGENFGSAGGTVFLELPTPAPAKPKPAPAKPNAQPKNPPAPTPGTGGANGPPAAAPAAAANQQPQAPPAAAPPSPAGAVAKPVPGAPATNSQQAQVVCWSDSSIQVILPSSGLSEQTYTVKVTPIKNRPPSPDQIRIVNSDVSAAKPTCPSSSAPSSGGTYTILPLIVSTNAQGTTAYFPISNKDANGKPTPLTWVVPAPQKTDTSTTKPAVPTTTITITKQMTGATPPATVGSAKAAPAAVPAGNNGGGAAPATQ